MNWKKERIRRHKKIQQRKQFRKSANNWADALLKNFVSGFGIQRALLKNTNEFKPDKSFAR